MRRDEASDASRLGNNEIEPPKLIGLNGVTKNRAPNNPIKPNPMEQRTAADVGMVYGPNWNKEELGADADV